MFGSDLYAMISILNLSKITAQAERNVQVSGNVDLLGLDEKSGSAIWRL